MKINKIAIEPAMSHLRTSIIAATLLAAAGAGIWYWYPRESTQPLLTTEVQARDIKRTVIATGTLEASEQVSVGAQVSGQIRALHVEIGDQVKKGELIAEIDSLTQQNALRDAQAALDYQQAQRSAKQAAVQQAQLAFSRQQKLQAGRAGTRADYESAEAALVSARAELAAVEASIRQARIQVETAQIDLGYTRITAPIDGTVVGVLVEQGQTVNSAQTTPTLVKVAQLDQMTVKAEISEADVVNVKRGQPLYFTILGAPNQRFTSTLASIELAPDSINADSSSSSASSSSSTDSAIYYNGVFDVPNPDGTLRIDMTAEVHIVLDSVQGVPAIPVSALGARSTDGWYDIHVQGADGRIQPRRIRTGLEDGLHAQVLEGLQVGERVVLGDPSAGSSMQLRRPPMGGL